MNVWHRWLRGGRSRARLKLAQSLGAFRLPAEGDISPLYVFFEVENAGREEVRVARLYVRPKGAPVPVYSGPFETHGELPGTLRPGEGVRFWVRAKLLARALEGAGYAGRPKIELVAEDGSGSVHSVAFGFRVDEYLALKDE